MKKDTSLILFLFIISSASAVLYSGEKKIFPHKIHIEMGIECVNCHPGAPASSSASDELSPSPESCAVECHEKDITDNIEFIKSRPAYELENNHEIHAEQGVECAICHKGLNNAEFTPGSAFPEMPVCFECHDNDTAPRTCTLCHIQKVPFSHKVHLDNGIDCESCHKNILTSTKTERGKNMPDPAVCAGDCHNAEDRYAEVTLFDAGEPAGRYEIIFNHEIHIEQDMKCNDCHADIKNAKYIPGSGAAFPHIQVCFKCHDNKTAERTCTLCHPGKVQFPHQIHIKSGMGCTDCHPEIMESKTTAGGRDIPSESSCSNCHEEKDFYHKITIFPYRQHYVFNHKLHADEQDMDCKDCHKALYTSDRHTQEDIVPSMNMCFDCHDNSTATKYCTLCHLNPTMPKDHYEDWDTLHKIKARRNLSECTECHLGGKKDYCFKCHRGVKKPINSHNPNFELTHKYEVRSRLQNCRTCHSERQCRNCHISKGINIRSNPRYNPHPPGFVGNRNSPNFHRRKARLNLSACTACHTKRDCRGCHVPMGSFRK